MSLTRQQKEQHVSEVQKNISGAVGVAFVSYDGLTVEEVNELRTNLANEQGSMRVIPKRLLKIAVKNADLKFDPSEHDGQMAVVWNDENAVSPAKVLYDFAKEHDNIKLLAGVLDGKDLSLEEVESLAQLPSKEQLLGQLVSVLSGPARGFATVLSGVQRQTVFVLQAIADQKSK